MSPIDIGIHGFIGKATIQSSRLLWCTAAEQRPERPGRGLAVPGTLYYVEHCTIWNTVLSGTLYYLEHCTIWSTVLCRRSNILQGSLLQETCPFRLFLFIHRLVKGKPGDVGRGGAVSRRLACRRNRLASLGLSLRSKPARFCTGRNDSASFSEEI